MNFVPFISYISSPLVENIILKTILLCDFFALKYNLLSSPALWSIILFYALFLYSITRIKKYKHLILILIAMFAIVYIWFIDEKQDGMIFMHGQDCQLPTVVIYSSRANQATIINPGNHTAGKAIVSLLKIKRINSIENIIICDKRKNYYQGLQYLTQLNINKIIMFKGRKNPTLNNIIQSLNVKHIIELDTNDNQFDSLSTIISNENKIIYHSTLRNKIILEITKTENKKIVFSINNSEKKEVMFLNKNTFNMQNFEF